ncbi:hypothetical protein J7J18_03805 [bacterium]|nr:hypothetical protein [bacterium]
MEKVRPKIRELGVALEDIPAGESGRAIFRETEIEVEAYEYVREYHEIWCIGYSSGGLPLVTEHTPQELKFEEADGTPRRVTENYPLPVSMGRKAVTWTESKLITSAGATELISAPGEGKKIRVHGICFSNKHTTSVDVALSEKTDGTELKFRHVLAADGGNVDINLTDMCWDLSENTALQFYAQAAYSGGVLVSIGYTVEDVS